MKPEHFVFVFGSNLRGRHGKGAALYALNNFGAIEGRAIGLQGRSYAIPTKDARLRPLPLPIIQQHVDNFLLFSTCNPSTRFFVTQVGCGLAGYKPKDIAPMFNVPASARANLFFDPAWESFLTPGPTNLWDPRLTLATSKETL